MKILDKIKGLNVKLQIVIGFMIAIGFFYPIVKNLFQEGKPYIEFVERGPELVKSVDELRESLFVLTGVIASDLPSIDSCEYSIEWHGNEMTGRIKSTRSGNIYVFIPTETVGERTFILNYNKDTKRWFFIDFDGHYVELKRDCK